MLTMPCVVPASYPPAAGCAPGLYVLRKKSRMAWENSTGASWGIQWDASTRRSRAFGIWSLSEAAQLLERAQREGWNLVALDLGLDLSTSEGKRVANQFASVAAWERQMLSARSRETLAHARAQGVKLSSRTRARRESSWARRAGRPRSPSRRSAGSRRRA